MANTVDVWSETNADNDDADSSIALVGSTASIRTADDSMRAIMGAIARWSGADTISSASTTNLATVEGEYVNVTGTTTITALGTCKAGWIKYLKFAGALTFAHNASSLILPGGANITTAAGDVACMISEGSGNWRCVGYMRADGTALVKGGDPASDDGDSLGTTSLQWSDLFLASGGVINWANGNVAITHSSGQISLGDAVLARANLKDYGEVTNAIGSIGGGTQDIDLTLGNVVTGTVDTSTTTFTFSNPTASDEGCSFTLVLTNGGSQTVNWPASVDWAGGNAPSLTSSGVDVLTFFTVDGGTVWFGFSAGLDMQ